MRILLAILMILVSTSAHAITWTKDWSAADNGVTTFGGNDLKNLQDDIDSQVLLTTGDYTLSGTNTYSGANTFSGTTSIATINQQTAAWTMDGKVTITPTRTYSGYFTKDTADATGTNSYTGVGFKPRAVLFFSVMSSANNSQSSWGFDTLTNHAVLADSDVSTEDSYTQGTGSSIYAFQASGAPVTSYEGALSSLDADGFTISWTKTGAKVGTITVYYIAFGL